MIVYSEFKGQQRVAGYCEIVLVSGVCAEVVYSRGRITWFCGSTPPKIITDFQEVKATEIDTGSSHKERTPFKNCSPTEI